MACDEEAASRACVVATDEEGAIVKRFLGAPVGRDVTYGRSRKARHRA